MNEMTALQDNYTSMIGFIQRGDTANASQRIDQLTTELTQLKTDLPNIVTSLTK
jgi:Tfp pilus assembly protein PilN